MEPLFSLRFGADALAEVVSLITAARQEVQLHLHTEWLDEARTCVFTDVREKRQYMKNFSLEQQIALIGLGSSLLVKAGVPHISAMRAGSFGMGRETLQAVAASGLDFDSSYNRTLVAESDTPPGMQGITQPETIDSIAEYPLSVFRDGKGQLRHLQLGACSFSEMESVLWQARDLGLEYIVILSHNFELLNMSKTGPDPVVARRYMDLCRFLDRNRDHFRTIHFDQAETHPIANSQSLPSATLSGTIRRYAEQALRKLY